MGKRVIIVDNYDSFTYNIVQIIGASGWEPVVFRNDELPPSDLLSPGPDRVVISPGPGPPQGAGISGEVIERLAGKVPLLGICLGHQCIGRFAGMEVKRASAPVHGKVSPVFHRGEGIFEGMPNPFNAARYHSLVVDGRVGSGRGEISAWLEDGTVMGISLFDLMVFGVQFHPESFMTESGEKLITNFLEGL